jgi:sec-independent protein translocase protein TatB
MFGITFPELLIILVVALVVIGPEQLPKIARAMGLAWGRAQRYVNGVKADIARDMAVEEFRQMQQKVQQEAREAEQALSQGAQSATQAVDSQVRDVRVAIDQAALPPAAAPKSSASEQ